MLLKSVTLKNTYCFSQLHIEFDYKKSLISVILADQGCGKTAVIKNIFHALSWFPARLKDMRYAGIVLADWEIKAGQRSASTEVCVQIAEEIGQLSEVDHVAATDLSLCHWQLFKNLNAQDVGMSRVETEQLEQLITRYQRTLKQDSLQTLPLLAYYPETRFVHEINLLNKNNPAQFNLHNAYELTAVPFTTFNRFFEWLREITDIENAKSAYYFQQLLGPSAQQMLNQQASSTFFHDALLQARTEQHSPCLHALKQSLCTVFPELSELYLVYEPKLQLMLEYQNQKYSFQQLPHHLKVWIALVGDIVRRLCLLNPLSLYPQQEGYGIVLIDQIDAELDSDACRSILSRLQHAFPQLQFIVSASDPAILENAEDYQCLRLKSNGIFPIELDAHWQQHQTHYLELAPVAEPHAPAETAEQLPETTALDHHAADQDVQQLFAQIQALNLTQQAALSRLLAEDNDRKSNIFYPEC
ncbi:AAA family ATPase [Acinetobacter larvae]|uniref:Rad50/SbcC-type AAA domain-containing protein n=1 Tax=Acinetobacter larvae TaxID=1789224 RepID=A0A1B2M2F3_9GAMM|nr:AAA family ATPase [Acinetobacter larvae]AOA59364.1 hypothetical protein BFG52_14030 [Acinetobacter larvae]